MQTEKQIDLTTATASELIQIWEDEKLTEAQRAAEYRQADIDIAGWPDEKRLRPREGGAWTPEMRARMIANSQRYEAAEILKQLADEAPTAFGTAVLSNAARHVEGE